MRASDIWLLVLARDPVGAKTRLAEVLDTERRAELAIAMLRDVLAAARELESARHIVATESPTVGALALENGFQVLDVAAGGTNAAASAALRHARDHRAPAALVLAADLPLLSTVDLAALVDASRDASVVIAPDRHERGTNALLLRPPWAIEPAFGAESLRVHRERAAASLHASRVVMTPGLMYDLDDADDLRAIRELAALGTHTSLVVAKAPA